MLSDLRRRAAETLATARQAVLSTSGPAGLQAGVISVEAVGLHLYLLVPRTSDLLFNLEGSPLVVVTAEAWQARGMARLLSTDGRPDLPAIARTPAAAWCELVEVRPTRLYLSPARGLAPVETIDLP